MKLEKFKLSNVSYKISVPELLSRILRIIVCPV